MVNRWGNSGNNDRLYFGAPKSLQMVTAAMKVKDTCSFEKSYDQPRQHMKKQRHYFANKSLYSQRYGFSSSHVWMSELDHKESWVLKNDAFERWCWIILLGVPWTARRLNQLNLKELNPERSLEGLMLNWSSNTLVTWCKELPCPR